MQKLEAEEALENINLKKGGKAKDEGPVGIYKSIFLRTKVEQQAEKRKKDRKSMPRRAAAGGSPRNGGTGTGADAKAGSKKGVARPKTENEEQLL